MGTSSSRGGPSDKAKLLPSWAQPGGDAAPEDESDEADESEDGSSSSSPSEDEEEAQEGGGAALPAVGQPWRAAKAALTTAARTGGGDRRGRVKSAAAAYVRARGGGGRTAAGATSGRAATARLGSFLSAAAARGFEAALRSIDLGGFVGRPAEEVFAAIADALAPDGASVEDAAARAAVEKVMADLCDRVEAAGGDLAVLDTVTAEEVANAVVACVAAYVYERWVGELGLSIEKGTFSSEDAVMLEDQMKGWVGEAVALDLGGTDVLQIDWAVEGPATVDRVFRDAYSFLENAE